MKRHYRIAVLLLLAGAIIACMPVLYSLRQAREEAIEEKFASLDALALSLDQLVTNTTLALPGLHEEVERDGHAPCSAEGVARLQRFGLGAQFVKSALYLDGPRVVCSSNGALMDDMVLGEPNRLLSDGSRLYSQVHVPGVAGRQYVVLEKNNYALLIYPESLISPFGGPELSLGLFNLRTGNFSARVGTIHDRWGVPGEDGPRQHNFIDDEAGYLVVRRIVPATGAGIVVAAPMASVNQRTAQFAHLFIPIGITGSLLVLGMALLLSRRQVSTRAELLHAINKGHLFLLYQPVVDLQDGTCIGAEALLRWQRDNGTVVPPDAFIPFAEEAGLIHLVSRRVMELVQQDMTRFLRANPEFRIGINLSPRDLQSQQTPRLLAAMRQAIGPGCGRFVVEATEREVLEKASALEVVRAIRDQGIEVAIDDFGTGYSGLSSLVTYPFDILKLDKSFTWAACSEPASGRVARHIVELAKGMNMQTLVEGIETEEQAQFFRELGVHYGQGYLFGKPLTASELIAHVPRHSQPGQHGTPQPD